MGNNFKYRGEQAMFPTVLIMFPTVPKCKYRGEHTLFPTVLEIVTHGTKSYAPRYFLTRQIGRGENEILG